jgi:hypothetical protein
MLSLASTVTDLPFRGNRNYLHSTDLFPALTDFAEKTFDAKAFIGSLTIRHVISHQVRVDLENFGGAVGSFRIRNGVSQTKGWLMETNIPVLSRVPFDETTATQAAVSGNGFAHFTNLLPQYSAFELLLILTKLVATKENAEHWWFCQIEFRSRLQEIAPLESRLSQKILGRYLAFDIYQAGQLIGTITGMTSSIADMHSNRGTNEQLTGN